MIRLIKDIKERNINRTILSIKPLLRQLNIDITTQNLFQLQNQTNAINELKKFFGDEEKMCDSKYPVKVVYQKGFVNEFFEKIL